MSFQGSFRIRDLANDIANLAGRIVNLVDDIDSEDDENTKAHKDEIYNLTRQIDELSKEQETVRGDSFT